jgi:hypothetical protein
MKIKIRQIEISIQEEKEEGDAGSAASVSAKQPDIVRSWIVEGPFYPVLCIAGVLGLLSLWVAAGQAGCGDDKARGFGRLDYRARPTMKSRKEAIQPKETSAIAIQLATNRWQKRSLRETKEEL